MHLSDEPQKNHKSNSFCDFFSFRSCLSYAEREHLRSVILNHAAKLR